MTDSYSNSLSSSPRALTPQELARANVELRQHIKQLRELLGEWLITADSTGSQDADHVSQLRARTLRHLGKTTPRRASTCDHGGPSATLPSSGSYLFYCPKCRTHVKRDPGNTPR